MRILHISYSAELGGAARCAYRIHQALSSDTTGIESSMLVIKKQTKDKNIFSLGRWRERRRKIAGYLERKISVWLGAHDHFPVHTMGLWGCGLNKAIRKLKPDVIHIHWISNGMMSIPDISKISLPIVWTLHDLWPVLGIRHYPEKIKVTEIISQSGDYISSPNWLSRWIYKKKAAAWKDLNITFVSQCDWSLRIAQQSMVGQGHKHALIPCPLDTSVFTPKERKTCRENLSLDLDEKLILVGASGMVSLRNEVKGFKYFFEALAQFPKKIDGSVVRIVTIGNSSEIPELPLPVTHLGHINNIDQLSVIYSAADVLVVPSLMETFGQSISESMACGTPVVGFDLTSQKDLIEDGKTGYLAQFPDVNELCSKIELCLKLPNEIRKYARRKAEKEWCTSVVIKKYTDVYKTV